MKHKTQAQIKAERLKNLAKARRAKAMRQHMVGGSHLRAGGALSDYIPSVSSIGSALGTAASYIPGASTVSSYYNAIPSVQDVRNAYNAGKDLYNTYNTHVKPALDVYKELSSPVPMTMSAPPPVIEPLRAAPMKAMEEDLFDPMMDSRAMLESINKKYKPAPPPELPPSINPFVNGVRHLKKKQYLRKFDKLLADTGLREPIREYLNKHDIGKHLVSGADQLISAGFGKIPGSRRRGL